jgi:NAD(P)H dehydrogenase (quinone)
MSDRICVFSASGQVGRRTIDDLLERGAEPSRIVAGSRSLEKLAGLEERGVTLVRGDYNDRDSLQGAFQDVDTLVLIPSTSPIEPRVQEHGNALRAARNAGVRRVIFLSIAHAGGESVSRVAPFALYAEATLRLSGMDWLVLRMNLYTDPLADWAPDLAKMGRLPYPIRSGRIAYVTRDDVAYALASAALDPDLSGTVLELTGPRAISMEELAETLSEVTGSSIRFDSVPDEEFVRICEKDGTPEFITQVLLSLYKAVDKGEFENATDHFELITGRPAESVHDYLERRLAPGSRA